MYNKKFRKIYGGCALAMALAMAVAPISAFAASPNTEVNTVTRGTTAYDKTDK